MPSPNNALARSWLFEIVDSKTNKIEKSFTLILPPQQYTIKEKHRVSIIKTFGNAFIDDYGPDNLEITLKGISGTAHVFPTFRTRGSSILNYDVDILRGAAEAESLGAVEGYDGRGAFYTFRNEIMRYKDFENYDRKEMRVYDLYDEQAYKCVLLEFALDRTSEQPFRYPFTISLFVYARLDSKKASAPKQVTISRDPFNILEVMDKLLGWYDSAVQWYQNNIINSVAKVNNSVQLIGARLNSSLRAANRILESPLTLSKQMLSTVVGLAASIRGTYNEGKLTFLAYAQLMEVVHATWRETLAMYGFSVSEGAQQSKEEVIPKDVGVAISAENVTSRAIAFDTYSYSGLILYTVKGGDTLQSIAQVQLSDENLWIYIASVNGISDNEDLVVGEEIYIPIVTEGFAKDSFIITEDTQRNPYGTDIRLDADGNIVIQENSDVALIGGVENVKQSVDMRLKTLAGSMIKQTAFGLTAQPGVAGTEMAIKYLRMNLRAALISDPRIDSIKNIQVHIGGDRIALSMQIGVVGRDQTLPVDVVI